MDHKAKKLLTVTVPAYNSEFCLEKCLDSFCREDVLPRLEIIVVNDGSADRTSSIAHGYAERYPESFRVIDKENGGHGSTINAAVEKAGGKYFQAVDSDDWVLTENLPALLSILDSVSADMVLCDYHMVDKATGGRQPFRTEGIHLETCYPFEEFMRYPPGARKCCYFHGIIYRTEFYRQTGLRLPEKTYYEDQIYATIPAFYAKSVLPTGIFVYQYQVGNPAQSISNDNQVRNLSQIEKILWTICDFYDAHSDMTPERKNYFLFKLCNLLESYYAAGFLKDSNRKRGYDTAQKMRETVRRRCPELAAMSERGYQIAKGLHFLHIRADTLEKMKRTKIYYMLRKHI